MDPRWLGYQKLENNFVGLITIQWNEQSKIFIMFVMRSKEKNKNTQTQQFTWFDSVPTLWMKTKQRNSTIIKLEYKNNGYLSNPIPNAPKSLTQEELSSLKLSLNG